MCAPVQGNDAHIVNHLDQQDDVARCLKHLHVVVVSRGEQRRPRGEPDDASLGETPVLRTVCADPARTMEDRTPTRSAVRVGPLSFRRGDGWDPTVPRLDDQ